MINLITRRSALRGLALLSAPAAAVSASAAADGATLEQDAERVRERMAALHGGQWSIDIDHDDHFVLISRDLPPLGTVGAGTQKDIALRVNDLAAEMSALLTAVDGGKWMVRVSPLHLGMPNYHMEPADLSPMAQLNRGMRATGAALQALRPEGWWYSAFDVELGLAIHTWHAGRAPDVMPPLYRRGA